MNSPSSESYRESMRSMPPPAEPVEAQGEMQRVEHRLGTTLPEDYCNFIADYGTGEIGSMPVYVLNPFAPQFGNLFYRGDAIVSVYRQLQANVGEIAYGVYPEKGGLLPWGDTGNGHYLNCARSVIRTTGIPLCGAPMVLSFYYSRIIP